MKLYRKAPDWCAKARKLNKKETDYERKYVYKEAGDGNLHFRIDSGYRAYFTLHVARGAISDIAPPTVYVTASYTGADAEAVMNSVIMPLEESINGVEDMMYISSSASNAGLAIIQVYFKQAQTPIWQQSTCRTVWLRRRITSGRSDESRCKHDEAPDQFLADRCFGLY